VRLPLVITIEIWILIVCSSDFRGRGNFGNSRRKGGEEGIHFCDGERENVVRKDIKLCIFNSFGPCEAEKRSELAETMFFSFFCPFVQFSVISSLNKASDKRWGGGAHFLCEGGV
jgi:hypothetical protein